MKQLEVIQNEVAACTKCNLHSTRTNTVFSRGNSEALICFIGEAPGEEEDLSGKPFVGRSGKLLDRVLTEMGLNVEQDIYVCNIVKCRPPNNRRPEPNEISKCVPYLASQLSEIKARVIVALGNTSVGTLTGSKEGITKTRGKWVKLALGGTQFDLMPTYHPSFLLRNGSPTSEPMLQFKADIQMVLEKIKVSDE